MRFDPEKFDVDANLQAPPLAKYAVAIEGHKPDRGRIFGRQTNIGPLNDFSDRAQSELRVRVDGYDRTDTFDVVIPAPELPGQRRGRQATERLFELRKTMDPTRYTQMVEELNAGGFLKDNGTAVRDDLTDAEFRQVDAIMDRHAGP
jgi:hypothetical protein